ncbi:hypothetical protein SETIT_9G418800v2 [Setaria italica]|uniref:Uncharacterized protein n=1 Tax=Setaria italica TaxID=4555 RepID=K4AN56_SETIT|nr:hypothetical protein SETIT_9G418800v2 [Setaria italica]
MNLPGTGGMVPGMPGSRKMPGVPGLDNDNLEVLCSRSMPRGNSLRNQSLLLNKPSTVHKASSINSRLPRQASAAALIGMSALFPRSILV